MLSIGTQHCIKMYSKARRPPMLQMPDLLYLRAGQHVRPPPSAARRGRW